MAAEVSGRPGAQTPREVIRRLGATLVTVAVAPDGRGEALLAVGVDPNGAGAVELVQRAAAQGYAAIVLHLDNALPERVAVAARRRRIALLTATTDVLWVHLATMLRVGVSSSPDEEFAGAQLGDLFGFANSLVVRIRDAVAIEDPQSHVLAYSTRVDPELVRRVVDGDTCQLPDQGVRGRDDVKQCAPEVVDQAGEPRPRSSDH